jgi:thioredoxin 2
MTVTADAPPGSARTEALIIACPADGTLNRVPRAKLDDGPRCARCGNALFQGRPIDLDAARFERHVLKSDLPVVIDFWAEWCGPCRLMAPNFAAAAPRLEPRVRLAKVDTEAEPAIAGRYAIRGIPTMILFGKGRELSRTSGVMPTSAIVQWVEQELARIQAASP